jgi:hypothetical protein
MQIYNCANKVHFHDDQLRHKIRFELFKVARYLPRYVFSSPYTLPNSKSICTYYRNYVPRYTLSKFLAPNLVDCRCGYITPAVASYSKLGNMSVDIVKFDNVELGNAKFGIVEFENVEVDMERCFSISLFHFSPLRLPSCQVPFSKFEKMSILDVKCFV